MTIKQLYKKLNPQEFKIGREPFVAISLDNWYDIEDMLLMNNPKVQKELAEAKKEIEAGNYITLEKYHQKRTAHKATD